jgi:hypothetical protein
MRSKLLALAVVASLAPVLAVWLSSESRVQAQANAQEADDLPIFVIPDAGPFAPETVDIPQSVYITAWARSGHSNASSQAFSYWNDAGAIPPACSVCHSGTGFRSFHGLDGSSPGLPEAPIPTGSVVDCETCHNPGLASVTEITLPSGKTHPVDGGEASCMTCHQGRSSGIGVASAVDMLDDDTPDASLTFVNPHYATAVATLLGGYGQIGYHYPGKEYSGRFLHARPVSTCASCHDPHSLAVAEQTCLTCHQTGTAADIRIARTSFDGSGDLRKGIAADIAANGRRLLAMLEDYAVTVAGVAFVYDGARHPYFFADANGDGVADRVDGRRVPYQAWTPRLLKATYNWKVVNSDPAIHVHNPHYALELLHDSMEDIAGAMGVDFGALGIAR